MVAWEAGAKLIVRRPSPAVTPSLLSPPFDARALIDWLALTDFLELMPDWKLLNLDSRRFVNLAEFEDGPIIGLHDLLVAKPAQQLDTLEVMRQRSECHVEERLSEEDWRDWRPRWNDWLYVHCTISFAFRLNVAQGRD